MGYTHIDCFSRTWQDICGMHVSADCYTKLAIIYLKVL